ncbi:RNA-binding protein Nova-1 [Babesia caballi]|uniref:RNA-binding protein Nova-1 n=1 Tax=Babesia caballi TaxID=5871 RepID=A0AAV4LMT3_BABCB|nr:RNA-binding protein Nova-1 [Babesia caballi]
MLHTFGGNLFNNSSTEGETMASKDLKFQTPVDLKFSHGEDDAHNRRRNALADGATLLGYSEQAPWRCGSTEMRRSEDSIYPDVLEDKRAAFEASLASLHDDSERSNSCAARNYFERNTSEVNANGTFELSGQYGNDSACFSRYRDVLRGATTMRTSSVSLENELINMVESAWKSSSPKRESAAQSKKGKNVYLKILATQLVSGTIIGRGGKGFNWFRRKSRVEDILLSMPWELYPKTDLRTMFLEGTTSAVVKATCIVADLMLSKYAAQHSAVVTQSDRMLVLVVLPLFAKSAMERIRDTFDPEIVSVTLFQSSAEYKEFVAVIKGIKSKVKALVGAIANSIAETIDLKDYCHVAYPGPDGFNPDMLPQKRAADATVPHDRWSGLEEGEIISQGNNGDCEKANNSDSPKKMRYSSDSDTQSEDVQPLELSETVHAFADVANAAVQQKNLQLNMATAAVVSESNPTINSYPVNLNILIPASKSADAMAITEASKCYVTTAPSEDPDTIVFSLSGSFEEAVAVVSLIVSVV